MHPNHPGILDLNGHHDPSEIARRQIDLATRNAKALRKTLEPYVTAGRKVAGTRARRTTTVRPDADARTVKEWAGANGYTVKDRGRVPEVVRQAFKAAN